jgi:hypothetical protein
MKKLAVFLLSVLWLNVFGVINRDDFQITSIIDDQYSDNTEIGTDRYGNCVVVWSVLTSTYNTYRIYARRFGVSGIAIGDRFEITTSSRMCSHVGFALDVSDSGHFAVAWRYADGNTSYEACLRRYNSDGTPFDASPIKVNSDDTRDVRAPDVAVSNSGQTVVVWQQAGIKAANVPSNTAPLLQYVDVDTIGATPRVAMDDNNTFHVIWNRGQSWDLAYRAWTLGKAILPKAAVLIMDSDYVLDAGDIDVTGAGIATVVWALSENSKMNIKCRQMVLLSSAFYVEQNIDNAADKDPRIDVGFNGDFALTWASTEASSMYLRLYDQTAKAKTAAIEVFPRLAYVNASTVRPAVDQTGRIIVACAHYGSYLKRYTAAGSEYGVAMRVDQLGSEAAYPEVAVSITATRAAAAWEWHVSGRVLAQFFDNNYYHTPRNNILVNTTGKGFNPCVAIDNSSFVIWEDQREGAQDTSIFMQRFDSNHDASGSNSRVSNVGSKSSDPHAVLGNGRLFVVWEDRQAANSDNRYIYGQIYNESGTPAGGNFNVSTETSNAYSPRVATGGNDRFVVTWERRSGMPPMLMTSHVYAKMFDKDGNALGAAVRVDSGTSTASSPAVGMDQYGNCAVAWLDQRDATLTNHVYCQRFDTLMNPMGGNFRMDTSAASKTYLGMGVSPDYGILVSWQKGSNSVPPISIQSRIFNSDGTPQSGVVTHNNQSIRVPLAAPAVACGDYTVFMAWMNSHCSDVQDRDIWGEFSELSSNTVMHVKKPHIQVKNNIRLVGQNPYSRAVWYNRLKSTVDIFDVRGRLIARVRPGRSSRLDGIGVYILKAKNRPAERLCRIK